MSTVRSAETANSTERPEFQLWYYLAVAFVVGAALIASAMLPQQIFGLAPVAASGLVALIGFLAHRSGDSPFSTRPSPWTIVYLVVVAVALVGAFVLVATVVRHDDALWLA
jgi:hypothetical protein